MISNQTVLDIRGKITEERIGLRRTVTVNNQKNIDYFKIKFLIIK